MDSKELIEGKKNNKITAIIIVGSNEISMRISQRSNNLVRTIENLTYPLNLGRDTFVSGRLGFESVNNICNILKGFLNIAQEYKIPKVDIVAIGTTALREAHNREYVLDQIFVVTGLRLEVIDDRAEKLYNFQLIDYYISEKIKNSAIVVNIGSGNVAVLHYDNGNTSHFDTIRTGALRVSEVLGHMRSDYNDIIDDYLENFIKTLHYLDECKPTYFVASGHDINNLAKLCGVEASHEFKIIKKEKLDDAYEYVQNNNMEDIAFEFDLSIDKMEILAAQIAIFQKMVEATSAKEIFITNIDTMDALTMNKLFTQMFEKIIKTFNKANLEAVRIIAEKFKANKCHYSQVEKFSIKIFDKMKKIHGMGTNEKKILSIAAILHDIGKYVSYNSHGLLSYSIIKGLDIATLNVNELDIVANIALYHSKNIPDISHENYKILDEHTRVLVSKLSAIIRIGDSLDKCEESKIDDIDVKIIGEEFIITAYSNKNIELEKWVFGSKSKFFEEVFGLKPIIKQKRK